VRDGGVVVMAAACVDGVPDGGAFAHLLASARTPADLAGAAGHNELDRWQAQVLGRVLERTEVQLYSEGLSDDAVRAAQLVPVHDLTDAVRAALTRFGAAPRVAVLPEGPLTVATVAAASVP